MLFKLKQSFFLILAILLLNSCQTRWTADSFIKQKQNKEQKKKDKQKNKRKKEYQQFVEKERNRNYSKQANKTKKTWDSNSEKSDRWIKDEFHSKSLKYRVRKFFVRFKREKKPKLGNFSKKQQRKRKKGFFRNIFKKKKRKK